MAATAHEAVGGPGAVAGAAPTVLSWPLPGCRPDSLGDLFSARALAELARVAGAAGGAVVLDLGGHTLQAAAGGRPGLLRLLEGGMPPAGLRSLALRNGTLALLPGMGLAFASKQPFAVCLERVKVTRPAPTSSFKGGNVPMVYLAGARLTARLVVCRVELSRGGPAGDSVRQSAVGPEGTVSCTDSLLALSHEPTSTPPRHPACPIAHPPPGTPPRHPACHPARRHACPTRHPARRHVSTLNPFFCPGGHQR
jgi:hypothetical protein